MAKLFGNQTTEGLEENQDRLGGGYQPNETDIYDATIKVAYAGKSAAGAQSVTVIADIGDREYRETFYVTDREGKNYYEAKDKDGNKTGNKRALPGFTVVEDICLVTTGEPLSEQDAEEKQVKIYNPETKQEEPTGVMVLTGLTNQKVKLGIIKATENKSEKNQQTGNYDLIADTREVNFVDKVFHAEQKMTVVEAKNGATEASFHDAWLEKNKGVIQDRRKLKDGAQGGKSGRPNNPPQQGQQSERKSLFSNKS